MMKHGSTGDLTYISMNLKHNSVGDKYDLSSGLTRLAKQHFHYVIDKIEGL
jgi:hypothetical protein